MMTFEEHIFPEELACMEAEIAVLQARILHLHNRQARCTSAREMRVLNKLLYELDRQVTLLIEDAAYAIGG